MALGPGKYDAECTMVRDATEAEAVIVIVFGGNKGHGFSMQATSMEQAQHIADVLESIANQIRWAS